MISYASRIAFVAEGMLSLRKAFHRSKQKPHASGFSRFRNNTLEVYGLTVHTEVVMARHGTYPLSPQGAKAASRSRERQGAPPAMADKLRKLLFALETAETLEQLGRFPGWKLSSA